MAIGKRIAERLANLNWERGRLLEKLPDLTPQALSNLIRRDSKRSEWDEAIAVALGVSVLWLVYGRETPYQQNNVKPLTANDSALEASAFGKCLTVLAQLSNEGQLVALGELNQLAKQYPKNHRTSKPCQLILFPELPPRGRLTVKRTYDK